MHPPGGSPDCRPGTGFACWFACCEANQLANKLAGSFASLFASCEANLLAGLFNRAGQSVQTIPKINPGTTVVI
jgi:hypothetical protein